MTLIEKIFKPKKAIAEAIEEIHHEFSATADRLLHEAKRIISESAKKSTGKAARLFNLGFKKADEVRSHLLMQETLAAQKEISDFIVYYNQKYPLHKFITFEQANRICQKYNLVLSRIDLYHGFVPEKNVQEIEDFEYDDEDVEKWYWVKKLDFKQADTGQVQVDRVKQFLKDSGDTIGGEGTPEEIIKAIMGANTPGKTSAWIKELEVEAIADMMIMAPEKDFDITKTKRKGFQLQSISTLVIGEIPDPVVVLRVKRGFIIVTAWGDEASDPMVVNETKN